MNIQDIMNKLNQLEKENAQLKQQKTEKPGELKVTESEWKGYPVLHFEPASGKPFNMGRKKLEVIKEAWPQVEEFLKKYSQT